ncbi:zinc finger MYM-type protein 1-like [Papaver somniferum]|uniref:zinc finger MYM-type protein 1-like n=1 Tax=Papaver somniferum TaxID=3469 RepID=UPI000E6F842C|nr:zinc finger MYM-type protein 1-like [Papaver somniferum]
MTLIIRCVDTSATPVKVEEFFMGFLKVDNTTGQGLFEVLKDTLSSLQLDIDNIKGQGYDNGSNMKGIRKSVQNKMIQINPRAFYSPCDCHSLNLTISDMVKSSSIGGTFFAAIQNIYVMFSASPNRWKIYQDHVKEYCEDQKVRHTDGNIIKQDMENFEFLLSMVIWHNILSAVNKVSKMLQTEDIDINSDIQQLKGLTSYLDTYREDGFQQAISLISTRFKKFEMYDENFGFLFNVNKIHSVDDESLKESCMKLEGYLQHVSSKDIDGMDLFLELKMLTCIVPTSKKKPKDVLNFLKTIDGPSSYPNAWVAFGILLTIPVTVASA